MYILEEQQYFWFLLIIPVLALLYLATLIWKRRKQKQFARPEMLRELSPDRSWFKSGLKFSLLLLVFVFLVIALVNPKTGSKTETVSREGVDIVFAVDVSKSMDAEDVAPNRLDKSKQLITQIVNDLAGDRIGIIAYAASAFPQLPITTDYAAGKMFLQGMNTDMISSQGTAIKDAIELSTTYFNKADQTSKVLVIISDGEDHEGDIEDAIKEAVEHGIRIITVGVGTPNGGPIPIKRQGVIQSYKKDMNGETVITRLDDNTLKQIAKSGNGEYIPGNVTSDVTTQMKELLQTMDKTEFEALQYASYQSLFQWFLAIAVLLLMFDSFMLERKTSWIKRLNLFNERKR
jgi:Ca-activated chloride channel family protein